MSEVPLYRGTSLTSSPPTPPGTTVGPEVLAYCRVLVGAVPDERGTRVETLRGRSKAVFYTGTSLIRNRTPLGPNSRTMPRALCLGPYGDPRGGYVFL